METEKLRMDQLLAEEMKTEKSTGKLRPVSKARREKRNTENI